MEKKQYIRPLTKAIEIDASSMFATSDTTSLSFSSEEVEATGARANDRGTFEDLDDAFNF